MPPVRKSLPLPAGPRRLEPEKIKRKFPGLLEYLERRLGQSRGHGEERHFYCPFCLDRTGSESNKPKLDVNIRSGRVGCYRCEYGTRNLERFFKDLNGGTTTDVEMRLVAGFTPLPEKGGVAVAVKTTLRTAPVSGTVAALRPVRLPREYVSLFDCEQPKHAPFARTGLRYFAGRGAGRDLWEPFQVGYAWEGRFAMRLIFPVVMYGKQVYFTTRYAGDHPVKSLNPTYEDGYFSRDDVLFNYDAAVGVPRIAIVEGPFSCMAFHDPALGCPAVATLGKAFSDRQLALVAGLVSQGLREVVIALDPDAGKRIDAWKAALTGVVETVTTLKLDHGDPWDRRADLPALLANRGALSLAERVKGRFRASK